MCCDILWNISTLEYPHEVPWFTLVEVVALDFEDLSILVILWTSQYPRLFDLFLRSRLKVHRCTGWWCNVFPGNNTTIHFTALLAMCVLSLDFGEDFLHNLKLLSNLGVTTDTVVCIDLTLQCWLPSLSIITQSLSNSCYPVTDCLLLYGHFPSSFAPQVSN